MPTIPHSARFVVIGAGGHGLSPAWHLAKAIGYPSELIEGDEDCRLYMQGLFHDWQAQGITSVLHEKKGGYAHNVPAMEGLAAKGEALGVRVIAPVRVAGFRSDGGAVTAVETDVGDISCDQVVIAAGPWVRDFWHMLDLPSRIAVKE